MTYRISGNRPLIGAGAAALALALSGCANTDLMPASAANTVAMPGEDAARAMMAGVTVTTMAPDEWPGYVEVAAEVTPMKVRIENNSGQPLRIAYDAFALLEANGNGRFRALPLYRMDGEVSDALTVRDFDPITAPGFRYNRFDVAPYYGSVYPGFGTYRGGYFANPGFYDLYDTYYVDTKLPTAEMRQRALPEGVLAPGGYVEGYLYFEEVPSNVERVAFHANLINEQTDMKFGQIHIPYMVG